MASMESMAMVAAVQCDSDGSICFSSAAKAHVACTVPRITNHATTFGTAHNCSLWSHDCHRSASWPTTAVYRGQRTCAHAAWQIFCCMNHIKLARDQLAKRGGTSYSRNSAHCPHPVTWKSGRAGSGRNCTNRRACGIRTRFQRVPRRHRRRAPWPLGYAAPFCRLNASWFGILSIIRTSSRSSTCSSNRASHSTATW